ncbi:MAG TPA: response regulator [Trueperaceae bacterium]
MAKILVAEDLAGQRMVLDMLLSVEGFEVHLVEDGAQALEYLKNNTPDLAILDVRMPNVDGIEVCRRMKKVSRLKSVPVMILTALRDEVTLESARLAHADSVVVKPLEGKDFREEVKRLLAKGHVTEA